MTSQGKGASERLRRGVAVVAGGGNWIVPVTPRRLVTEGARVAVWDFELDEVVQVLDREGWSPAVHGQAASVRGVRTRMPTELPGDAGDVATVHGFPCSAEVNSISGAALSNDGGPVI